VLQTYPESCTGAYVVQTTVSGTNHSSDQWDENYHLVCLKPSFP